MKADIAIEFTRLMRQGGGGEGGGGATGAGAEWPAPILPEKQRKMSVFADVQIKKECGNDGICSPG